MIDRRGFIKVSAAAGAAFVLAPMVASSAQMSNTALPGCGDVPPCEWDPATMHGLDLHFDATQLCVFPVDSSEFAGTSAGDLGVSLGGNGWSQTGDLARVDAGVAMLSGHSASGELPAAKPSDVAIDLTAALGLERACICVVLEGRDHSRREIVLAKSSDFDGVTVTGGSRSAPPSRRGSGLRLGEANVIRVEVGRMRFVVMSNGTRAAAGSLPADWELQRYGFGFRDADTSSVVSSFVVRDLDAVHLNDGQRVAAIPQLAQPSRCVEATQDVEAWKPRFSAGGRGIGPALCFDGRGMSLTSNAFCGAGAFTVFAVVCCGPGGGGTIVGSNEANGGFQLRVDDDGSVVALNSGKRAIAWSAAGAVGDMPAIIGFSLDAGGNAHIYVNGQPVGWAAAPDVALPLEVTMSIGVTNGGEYFSGQVCEIVRWNRPLTGEELRTAFRGLAGKWGIAVGPAIADRVAAPLLAVGIKGSNIIPSRVDLADADPTASAWFNLWSRWDWNWIDRSVRRAVDQGANVIRLIGDVNAVYTGAITEATYHDRLEQVISRCAEFGRGFYYCAIDLRHKRNADADFIARFLGGVGGVLARNPNVLAVDLCNEVASGYPLFSEAQVVRWIGSWSAAIRRAAPQIPQSISDVAPGGLLDKVSAVRYYELYADMVDFFDLHVYEGAVLGEDSRILTPYELSVNRPLLIGEFGENRHAPGARPGPFYAQVRRLRDSSPVVRGAVQWGAVNDDYGLYSETGDILQMDIAPEWARF
ncbi:LamG-like jellyroll fold domain-containing protein [Rhodococcus sp. NPDC003322]